MPKVSKSEIEKAIGYTFKDKKLLKRALTLSAVSNDNNESLEFFGDAVLEFIVSEKLYKEGGSEGSLTVRRKALVSDAALTPVAKNLGLDKFLIRAKNDDNNKKAVPSSYEAVTAAIYLDGGIKKAKEFVLRTLDFENTDAPDNFKGRLQEVWQGLGNPPPEYESENTGTAKIPEFTAYVTVFGKTFQGTADSKKGAEQQAAEKALNYYDYNKTI